MNTIYTIYITRDSTHINPLLKRGSTIKVSENELIELRSQGVSYTPILEYGAYSDTFMGKSIPFVCK